MADMPTNLAGKTAAFESATRFTDTQKTNVMLQVLAQAQFSEIRKAVLRGTRATQLPTAIERHFWEVLRTTLIDQERHDYVHPQLTPQQVQELAEGYRALLRIVEKPESDAEPRTSGDAEHSAPADRAAGPVADES